MRDPTRPKHIVRSRTAALGVIPRSPHLWIGQDFHRLLRRQLFLELWHGEHTEADNIELVLKYLRPKPIPGAAILVQVDALTNPFANLSEERKSAIRRHIGKAVKSLLEEWPASLVEDPIEPQFATVVSPSSGACLTDADLRRTADFLCREMKASCHETLTVGIGTISTNAQDLGRSFREAKESLSYQTFLGNDRFISPEDVRAFNVGKGSMQEPCGFTEKHRKLTERIFAFDKEGAFETLDELLDALRNQSDLTPTDFKSFLLLMVVVLCRTAIRVGTNFRTVTMANVRIAEAILEMDNYPTLRAFLRVLIEDLVRALSGHDTEPRNNVVVQAKKYLAENYAKSPTLQEVADYVHLNPCYFSRLFAKENDCGFHDHVNRLKIEAAKDLLRHSPLRIKQVAQRVGFKNVSHFVRLFRRLEGVTPTEFSRFNRRAAV